MNKFYYSRTYTFEAPKGHRKHYSFNLVERYSSTATFRLTDKDNTETVEAPIVTDSDAETVVFTFRGIEFSLRADRFIPKGYSMSPEDQIAKEDDKLKDAYLHTIYNRDEIERSKGCYCISCQTFFKPEEIEDYADEGRTGICPNCYCDAIIADGSGIKMSDNLLESLNHKYFNYDDIDTKMEIYIATDLAFVEGAYRFNAVYAFKSKTSVKSYNKYLESTGENHKLIVTPYSVADLERGVQVVTEFEVNGDLTEYKSTKIFDDYDDACDYVANIKETQPAIKVEHDCVIIYSRFSPNILHCGWAFMGL